MNKHWPGHFAIRDRLPTNWLLTNWPVLLFLLCALPAGLGAVLLTPIGESPDEPEHIARADGLASGQILGSWLPGGTYPGVMMNVAMFRAAVSETGPQFFNKPIPAPATRRARALRWEGGEIFCETQMVRYFPVFYAPGAAGMLLGRALQIPPLYTLFIGRCCMLLSYLVMGAAALRCARFGRPLLFAVLTLPMSVILAASFNQDGPMIGAAVLAAALLTRERRGLDGAWWLALLLLTLIASAKAPYAWLLLLCVLPLRSEGLRRRLVLVAAAGTLPVLWLFLSRRADSWPWPRAAYHPGPLWPGSRAGLLTATNAADNVRVLMAHPAAALLLPARFILDHGGKLWPGVIGAVGWDLAPLGRWQLAGWSLALLAALAASAPGRRPPGGRDAVLVMLLLLVTFVSIALSAYVTFSNVGAPVISGLAGRYLIPLLPFLPFTVPFSGWPAGPTGRGFRVAAWLPAAIMAGTDIYALPAQIFRVFGMRGP